MFSSRWHNRGLCLVTLWGVSVACGETTHSGDDDPSGSGASGGTGGVGGTSVDVGGSGGFNTTAGFGGNDGPSTTAAFGSNGGFSTTAAYGGNSGFNTTAAYGGNSGFSTTAAYGGTGGNPSCGGAEPRLEGCYTIGANAGGNGGEGGASGFESECWFYLDCEASFEGQVLDVGAGIDARWCDLDVFGGLTHADVSERQWLVIADGNVVLRVVLGRPAGELDVEIGDTVEAQMVSQSYHADLMTGRRLTLTKNGELLAVLNNNLPIDDGPMHFGELRVQRGMEFCQRPVDSDSCTYVAHDLEFLLDDEGISVPPNASARLGPYEILTDANFEVRDGGDCENGDTSDFLIARVKP